MKPKKPTEGSGFTREDIPKNVKRVIIKVGTSVLTRDQEFGVSLTARTLDKIYKVGSGSFVCDLFDCC